MLRYLTYPTKYTLKLYPQFYFGSFKNFSKKFTKDHEWISVEKELATIGITDYAQNELGEIVHVELPKLGDRFKHGESLGAIESVKTAADIYSPVEGVIAEVNEKLTKTPKLLNTHPQSQGWYAKLKVDQGKIKSTIDSLMSEEQYQKFTQDIKK